MAAGVNSISMFPMSLLIALLVLVSAQLAHFENWTVWRGPRGDVR